MARDTGNDPNYSIDVLLGERYFSVRGALDMLCRGFLYKVAGGEVGMSLMVD